MQDVIRISTIALGGSAHSHESRLDPMDHDAAAGNRAAARSPAATTQASWQVTARDVHPGDVVQQFDWPLHVRAVTLGQTAVQITVTEFDFPLQYPADAKIQLAAGRTAETNVRVRGAIRGQLRDPRPLREPRRHRRS